MGEVQDEVSAVASVFSVLCVVCRDYPLSLSVLSVSDSSFGTPGTNHHNNRCLTPMIPRVKPDMRMLNLLLDGTIPDRRTVTCNCPFNELYVNATDRVQDYAA